ncbi:MAG: tripartite tricarboxylate transporter substrate binding protein [Alcaligenaceae bacterium]|nr:tripartite tricarboxylate transporter substrate binding protein [Alcaligenaceae bacterium]
MLVKKFILAATALTAVSASVSAFAAEYPERPIKLVVSYAAGGPVDTTARSFAKFLSDELKQSVVVENKTGAGGMIGAESVIRSNPDGYTLAFLASPVPTIAPHIQKSVKIDFDNDFTYIGNIVDYTNVLVVNNDLPIKSVQELVEYARKNPNTVAFGSAGIGSSSQLSAELLKQKTDTDMLHVPYRGNSPAMIDVISGKISFMFDISNTAASYIQGGKVRALAVTSKNRNSALPDVPTMIEAGIEDYAVTGWYALAAPKGLPDNITQRLELALRNIDKNPEFDALMERGGYTRTFSNGAELKARQSSEYKLWGEVIEKANIQLN